MPNALAAAADIEGTIDSGERFVDAASAMRTRLAYSCCPPMTTRAGWKGCAIAMALAEFAQRAAQNYLETRPARTFTVDASGSV
jgi:hypothetical protein